MSDMKAAMARRNAEYQAVLASWMADHPFASEATPMSPKWLAEWAAHKTRHGYHETFSRVSEETYRANGFDQVPEGGWRYVG